jgi:hypothetical protein
MSLSREARVQALLKAALRSPSTSTATSWASLTQPPPSPTRAAAQQAPLSPPQTDELLRALAELSRQRERLQSEAASVRQQLSEEREQIESGLAALEREAHAAAREREELSAQRKALAELQSRLASEAAATRRSHEELEAARAAADRAAAASAREREAASLARATADERLSAARAAETEAQRLRDLVASSASQLAQAWKDFERSVQGGASASAARRGEEGARTLHDRLHELPAVRTAAGLDQGAFNWAPPSPSTPLPALPAPSAPSAAASVWRDGRGKQTSPATAASAPVSLEHFPEARAEEEAASKVRAALAAFTAHKARSAPDGGL